MQRDRLRRHRRAHTISFLSQSPTWTASDWCIISAMMVLHIHIDQRAFFIHVENQASVACNVHRPSRMGRRRKHLRTLECGFVVSPQKSPQRYYARSIWDNQGFERLKPLGVERERKRRAETTVWRTNVSPQNSPIYTYISIC